MEEVRRSVQARTDKKNAIDSHGQFVWYELMTSDLEAAKVFYAKVVGWATHDVPGMVYTLFMAGDVSISGVLDLPEDARKKGAKPGWVGYVGVDDVDETARRVERLGGTLRIRPTDIPEISRFSVFADPQMATLALFNWLIPGQERPAESGALGRVGWHELLAADWETAWAFYSEIFGWQKGSTDIGAMGTYQLFSRKGQIIGGMFTKPETEPVPYWLYYFNVGDIDAAAKRVRAAGGEVVNGPTEVPGDRWIIRCTDPQGAIFALRGTRSHNGIGYFERLPRGQQS